MKTNYFDLYLKWIDAGTIDDGNPLIGGLCSTILENEMRKWFQPDPIIKPERTHYVDAFVTGGYWGYDGEPCPNRWSREEADSDAILHGFTPTRQNIVLLLAAMEGQIP